MCVKHIGTGARSPSVAFLVNTHVGQKKKKIVALPHDHAYTANPSWRDPVSFPLEKHEFREEPGTEWILERDLLNQKKRKKA